ncbi:MAG: hypothetical protein AAF810_21925, partial [Cyanobacteria bacterium P01_D01_bin.36]
LLVTLNLLLSLTGDKPIRRLAVSGIEPEDRAEKSIVYWAFQLMALKPHKRCFFRRGLQALSLIQQAF